MNIDIHITSITVTLIIIIDALFLGIIIIIVFSNAGVTFRVKGNPGKVLFLVVVFLLELAVLY